MAQREREIKWTDKRRSGGVMGWRREDGKLISKGRVVERDNSSMWS